jgi:hypothetical protein
MSPVKDSFRRPFPTPGTVVSAVALAWALFGIHLFHIDGDVGRHIRVGRHILSTGEIPRSDIFSHTMLGEPFVPFEWLSEVCFAAADRIAGLTGVAVLSALLFAATSLVVYSLVRRLGVGPLLASMAAALSMVLQAVHLLPRPHLFTTLFAAVFLMLLETYRIRRSVVALGVLIPIMALWTNLHGGFLVGFVLLAVYSLDAWRPGSAVAANRIPLVLTAAACLIASFLNPAGFGVWTHSLSYFGMDFLVDQTNEYQSPDFHQLHGKVFLVSILIGLSLLGSGISRAGFRDLTLFLGWLAAGLMSARNIPLFGVLAVPWFAPWVKSVLALSRDGPLGPAATRIEEFDSRMEKVEAQISGFIPTVVLALILIVFAARSGGDRYAFEPESFPVRAVAALDELSLSGNVFNEMPWGGYLLYTRPDIPVFIDGQTDFYGEDLSRDYLRIRHLSPGGLDLLDDYEVDWILTPPTVPLSQGLSLDSRWRLEYEDAVAQVYARVFTE